MHAAVEWALRKAAVGARHQVLVAERLLRMARLIGAENVMAGTDCGFAQGPFHRRVHPTIMWAKLEALVAGARLASEELHSRRAP